MQNSSSPRNRLADEHAALLDEVEARRQRVLLALDRDEWPRAEIEGLVGYLRYELLDQAVHEERLLYPLAEAGFANEQVRRLTADHVQLRDCADALAAASGDAERDREQLTVRLDELSERLIRHLRSEQEVLAAATDSGVQDLRRPYRSHDWYALTEGDEVDVDLLSRPFAVAAVLDRLARLRPGECLQLTSSEALTPVQQGITRRDAAGDYGWAYLEEGPPRWRATITKRAASG